ncbi:MAG: TolC family protein [Bacteroidales bacterium]|nr:TolC family protein [Bacteroidales bacterium]
MRYRHIFVFLFFLFSFSILFGQTSTKQWTLEECIKYALENNLDIKKVKLSEQEDVIDRKQAIASLFPSVSGSVSQSYNRGYDKDEDRITGQWGGSYSLGASVDLFRGLKNFWTLKQTKIQSQQTAIIMRQTEYDIKIAITKAYMQILYYQEALNIATQNRTVAQSQMERGKKLLEAGSSSKSEYATLQSQYASANAQVVKVQNSLDNMKLQLKQLLEMGIDDEIDVVIIDIDESQIMVPLADKKQIYQNALNNMPAMHLAEVNKKMAALNYKIVLANCFPSLSLNGSIGSSNVYGTAQDFGDQMKNTFRQSLSLGLSIPIFTNLQSYASVQKAKIQQQSIEFDYAEAEDDMLKTIESLYQDCLSAQAEYLASKQQLESAELSYDLVAEKFSLGMQNATDILVERNNLNAAQQNVLQNKYTALLSQLILNIYQGV